MWRGGLVRVQRALTVTLVSTRPTGTCVRSRVHGLGLATGSARKTRRAAKQPTEAGQDAETYDAREEEEAAEMIRERTLEWAERVVVGLRLCPFARLSETRVVVAPPKAHRLDTFLSFLQTELELLRRQPEVASTLAVFPYARDLGDFEAFNAVVNLATAHFEDADEEANVEPMHQIAQFHPQFRYEGVDPDSVENYTSRSPFPTVHLLRAAIITEAREKHGEEYLNQIPEANAKRLHSLGLAQVRKLCPAVYPFEKQ